MTGTESSDNNCALAIIHGPPLNQEPGLGALTLPGYLREVTQRYGDREALVFYEHGQPVRWTYAQLWNHSVDVARALLATGCGKDTRVGILMTNRPEWLSAVFGAAIAGCVAVPLNTFSTESELDYLITASAISVLLLERRVAGKDFAAMLANLEPGILRCETRSLRFPHLRYLAMVDETTPDSSFESWNAFLDRGSEIPEALALSTGEEVKPSDVGAILFSSGSTARAKGVINTHRGIAIHLWRWRRLFALHGDVRAWTPNGFFWSGNFGTVLGATLSAGGTLVLQSIFDPEQSLELMAKEKVSYPSAWPHQWKQVVEAANWAAVDLSAVRFLDPKQPLASHPTIQLCGWYEPLTNYGSTETFTITTGCPNDGLLDAVQGSHGFALAGNTLKIVDPISGKLLSRCEQGEIAVKGPTLMTSYLGLPADECFDAEGFYRTGDAGWIDEQGRLHFEGRLSTVIKTGGANVSPLEVEQVLETFPGVKMICCVGVPDDLMGELVVGCVVPAEGETLSADHLRDFARERLASYKVPRKFLFLSAAEVELTSTAKIRHGEIRKLAIEKLAAMPSL